jgi:hypothetical protein
LEARYKHPSFSPPKIQSSSAHLDTWLRIAVGVQHNYLVW